MAEIRVQVAYHFKIDPAQLTPGLISLPEQIIRTVSVGDDFSTEKVSGNCLSLEDRSRLQVEIDKQCVEATRTARPVVDGETVAETPAAGMAGSKAQDEISAF